MLLDLSLLPAAYRVPVFAPAVPLSEKTKTGTNGPAETLDLPCFQDAVPVVPSVPVTFAVDPQAPKTGITGIEAALPTSQPVTDVPRRCPAYQPNGKTASVEGNHTLPAPHNCHTCPHWGGVNHHGKGECTAEFRPWRVSNVAGTPDHYRWHYVGQCSKEIER